MDIATLRTFLELAATGNFSRVAERLHLTQSTVSARIKVLEEQINCVLFERTPSRVNLTPAGQRFHRYVAEMQRLWRQGQQDVALPAGFEGSIGIGSAAGLWQRVFPRLINWMRDRFPSLGVHLETGGSGQLIQRVSQGLLDVVVTDVPQVLPELHVEQLGEDKLVMVSRRPMVLMECRSEDYVYVDWGSAYRDAHCEKLPHLSNAPTYIDSGDVALQYVLDNAGFVFLPISDVKPHIESGRLSIVEDSPTFSRLAYLVYAHRNDESKVLRHAVEGLKNLAVAA